MEEIMIEINLFGTNKEGFLNAIKHYSDVKGGYDAIISSYDTAAYTVRPLAANVGTVPIRNNISFQDDILSKIPGLEPSLETIGLKLFIPVRKGFQVTTNAALTSWDGSEVLAKLENIKGVYIAPNDPGNIGVKDVNANDNEYGYLPLLLSSVDPVELNDPRNFLQAKIKRWRDKSSDISKQVFVLRVWQMVWPANMTIDNLTSEDFEVRDDSLVIEIRD